VTTERVGDNDITFLSFYPDRNEHSLELARIPRYVRINALKWTVDEAIEAFQRNGFVLGDPLDDGMYVPPRSFINSPNNSIRFSPPLPASPPNLRNFTRDAHIENLLLFPPQARLIDTPEYSDGRVILQDKASCFPAFVLAPPSHPRSVIIDATAAPGNKTSHLSALMGNQGKVQTPRRFRFFRVQSFWTISLFVPFF
jgi:putative methyltransferase